MATVNFSVPDEVKKAFDRAFKGKNKSAVVAEMMRRAIADVEAQKRRTALFRMLTDKRKHRPRVTDKEILDARAAGRS